MQTILYYGSMNIDWFIEYQVQLMIELITKTNQTSITDTVTGVNEWLFV
jgi:hypothetical protein